VDSNGYPMVAVSRTGHGGHVASVWDGASWVVENVDPDRHTAELDFEYGYPALTMDDDDVAYLLWTDCNDDNGPGLFVRTADGVWEAREPMAKLYEPNTTSYGGDLDMSSMLDSDTMILPDGRLAAAVVLNTDGSFWYLEGALLADGGADVAGPGAASYSLDGSGSSDAWGEIVSYAWSGAPDGCTLSGSGVSVVMWCVRPVSGDVTLTVMDTDGLTHTHRVPGAITAPECDLSPDPFTDVSASSFARDSVTCIYNLGVTTGVTLTMYEPAGHVSRVQMALFMQRLYETMTNTACPVAATPFTDVSFGSDAIGCIYGLGVTSGTTDTTYSTGDPVSRLQMALFMSRLWEAIQGASAPAFATPFIDVPLGSFGADAIAQIYGLGVTTGATVDSYDRTSNVSRIQMAAFLQRLYEAVAPS